MIADFGMGCLRGERDVWRLCDDMGMIDLSAIRPIGSRWDLGLLEGREACKLCGNG